LWRDQPEVKAGLGVSMTTEDELAIIVSSRKNCLHNT